MRFLRYGPSALLVELDDLQAVSSLVAQIHDRQESGWHYRIDEVVPGMTTVLLDGVDNPTILAQELSRWAPPPEYAPSTPSVEIPCHYGGPDLAWVASHWGVTDDEVATVHSSLDHRVAFCGFSPGFAYIVGLGERWSVPRLVTPRAAVEAGSIAVAGCFTGVYPRSSPGGWRIIGHTDAAVWDTTRAHPALFAPGQPVRFVAV